MAVAGTTDVQVTVENISRTFTVSAKTTFLDVAKMAGLAEEAYIAYVGNRIRELFKTVGESCTIRFAGMEDKRGFEAYRRSTVFVMVKSFYDLIDIESDIRVFVDNTIDNGFFCRVADWEQVAAHTGLDRDAFIAKLAERMQTLINEDADFKKEAYPTGRAIELFHKYHMYDKERLFHYRRAGAVNVYRLHRFQDYYYGYMLPSTGYIKHFAIYPLDEGFLLQCPTRQMEMTEPDIPRKLFHEYRENHKWISAQGISTLADLNDIICAGDRRIDEIIQIQESYHDKQLATIADMIAERPDTKFVMIAGPSGSGKTTFSKRLNIQLLAHMVKPFYLGLDNYFKEREEAPRLPDGEYDFESLDAIDVDLFNDHMRRLQRGERVKLPTYNFITGKKEYRGNAIQLDDNQILVIEGIHGLNDKLSYTLDAKDKFKIYLSPLTQLNIDEHNRISTSDVRLIRRIVRDARTRGTRANRTIEMWRMVREGEEKYIFPYQEEADVMFNSSLIYELSVLKVYAQPLLFGIRRDDPEYIEVNRLLKFLEYFVGIDNDRIPKTSLIREFIGGSFFDVG
ncbi:MAG: nucleoside kinase [Eubacteriales bacterium]|nr:nucleoside kinase [Eubacteriales bacterium]